MQESSAWRRNRYKLTALKAGSSALLYLPILVLFLQKAGLTFFQVLVLQGASALVLAFWQVPSGYIADRWGRKNTLIVGAASNFLGVLCYCFGNHILVFLLATSLLSTGLSFQSGTIEALTYESLEAEGHPDSFRKNLGNQAFLRFSAEALASLLGGALAVISLRLAFWATLPSFAAMIVLACTLREPPRVVSERPRRHLAAMLQIVRRSLVEDRRLRYVILFGTLVGSLCVTLYWFAQPYQVAAGVPLGSFGLIHGAVVLAGAAASRETHRLGRWLRDGQILAVVSTVAVACYLCLGLLPPWGGGVAFIILMRFAWGFLDPVTFDLMNRMTTPDVRATILSVRGFLFQIFFAFLPPLFGLLADEASLRAALLALGVFTGLCAAALLLLLRPVWKEIPA